MVSEAKRERARRELARRRLYRFCQYVTPGYPEARHLRLLCDALEGVERYVATKGAEGIGRLMIFMPPRYWKSQTASVRFPAWVLGRNPDVPVLVTSYAGDLAHGFSRQCRNTIAGGQFQAVFGELSALDEPVRLAPDSQSAQEWHLDGFIGGMRAAGVGGGITGKGARLLVIDDPHKDRKEAESETIRNAVDDWYKSAAYPRLEDNGAVVLIMTRWHADDLAGRLLRRMVEEPDADVWTVLSLPAEAETWASEVPEEKRIRALKDGWYMGLDPLGREPGEALWPEKYPLEMLTKMRGNVGGYEWAALFSQRPRRVEGTLIKAGKIKIIEGHEVPAEVRPVRYWDLGVGRSKKAHWCCGAKCGRDGSKRFYIMDIRRIPAPWSEARPKIKKVMLEDEPEVVQGVEVAGQQDGYYQNFRDDVELQMRSIVPVPAKAGGDKIARAQLWATRIEDDKVFMVRGPWNEDFISEAVAFPMGASDDMVDGVSGGWQMTPGFVSWEDIPQAQSTDSVWNLFRDEVKWPG